MSEVSTWFILKELEKRLSDSVYDIEPQYDSVLTNMDVSGRIHLYNTLKDFNDDYERGVADGVY